MIDWLRGNYTIQEKNTVIAWVHNHNLVSIHNSDAQQEKQTKRNK